MSHTQAKAKDDESDGSGGGDGEADHSGEEDADPDAEEEEEEEGSNGEEESYQDDEDEVEPKTKGITKCVIGSEVRWLCEAYCLCCVALCCVALCCVALFCVCCVCVCVCVTRCGVLCGRARCCIVAYASWPSAHRCRPRAPRTTARVRMSGGGSGSEDEEADGKVRNAEGKAILKTVLPSAPVEAEYVHVFTQTYTHTHTHTHTNTNTPKHTDPHTPHTPCIRKHILSLASHLTAAAVAATRKRYCRSLSKLLKVATSR